MELKVLYENNNLLVIDKPAGIIVFPERKVGEKTLIDFLLEKYPNLKNVLSPPRYGIVHRLDKDTSGILLVAKNNSSLEFLQRQFKIGKVQKKYLLLVVGNLKSNQGTIETLIGRSVQDRRKQRVYFPYEPAIKGKKLRRAITEYKVVQRFKNYTLIEALPKTGRKHQIRTHLTHLGHPIAGDKLYRFKRQPFPEGLKRQFLHSRFLKIKLPSERIEEFHSQAPKDLKEVLKNLK